MNVRDSEGWTTLSRAARNGHPEIIRALLEACESSEERWKLTSVVDDETGGTPLSRAACNGQPKI
eukprot:12913146-Prorocentrum_lima.AAC.1